MSAEKSLWPKHTAWAVGLFLAWWVFALILTVVLFQLIYYISERSSGVTLDEVLGGHSFSSPTNLLGTAISVGVAAGLTIWVDHRLCALEVVERYGLPREQVRKLTRMGKESRRVYMMRLDASSPKQPVGTHRSSARLRKYWIIAPVIGTILVLVTVFPLSLLAVGEDSEKAASPQLLTPATATKPLASGPKTYRDTKYGFSFVYERSDWELNGPKEYPVTEAPYGTMAVDDPNQRVHVLSLIASGNAEATLMVIVFDPVPGWASVEDATPSEVISVMDQLADQMKESLSDYINSKTAVHDLTFSGGSFLDRPSVRIRMTSSTIPFITSTIRYVFTPQCLYSLVYAAKDEPQSEAMVALSEVLDSFEFPW